MGFLVVVLRGKVKLRETQSKKKEGMTFAKKHYQMKTIKPQTRVCSSLIEYPINLAL